MTQEERYRDVLAKRFNATGNGVQDFSGPTPSGVGRDAIDNAVKSGAADAQGNAIAPTSTPTPGIQNAAQNAGAQMATQGAQSGNMAGMAGGAMMMSGNPYLMAGGLGLQVLASGEQNKRKEEEAQRQAYNEKIKQRQAIMSNIASMGIQ